MELLKDIYDLLCKICGTSTAATVIFLVVAAIMMFFRIIRYGCWRFWL